MKNLFLIAFLAICSCASYNVPSADSPNKDIPPNTSLAVVDLNGNFYPDNWRTEIGPQKRKSSLFLTAQANGDLDKLRNFETKKLAEYRKNVSDKKRVFIFVHGYNNDAKKAKRNYDLLRTKININQASDEVIEFYWDGLVSKDPVGSSKIWFNAVGYSQMAGEWALRKIINQIYNKDIYIISHSRGASVVLSALSNPPYDPNFRNATESLGIAVDNPVPLSENNNKIVSIMLAPAIGQIDFKMDDNYNKFRSFSNQLKSINITVNKNDPALNKYVGLADKFNETTLGRDRTDFDNLNKHYGIMTLTNFDGQKDHSFTTYINNVKFKKMVENYIKR